MDQKNKTFDIFVGDKKVGIAHDTNPVVIETDKHCREILLKVKDKYKLTEQHTQLIIDCIKVLDAKDDDLLNFGLGEILLLSELAAKYPKMSKEITACSHYLSNLVNFEGEGEELSQDFFPTLFNSNKAMADLFDKALKSAEEK